MKKKPLKKYKHNFKQKVKDFENKNKHKKVQKNRELRKKDKVNTQQQYINLESYGSFKPGEYIVCDLKHMPKSIDGYEYLCTFTCLGTRLSESVFFSTRLSSEFLEAYKKFCKHIRNKTGRYPKYLQTDNGKEFIDKHTKDYNLKKGITHSFTSPHSSLQNPVAERINRTIGEGCLALLLCAHLPLCFWTYAVSTFNFVKARTPHKSLNFSNPISSWNIFNTHRASIDLFDIRIFGCEAYVLDEKSLKAHPKAFRCIYLGPSDTHKGCIFYNLYTKKIIFSRNFILNEQCVPGKTYFPNIYDRYFGSTPPFDISDLTFSIQQPTTVSNLDFNNIPYSNLFHFENNTSTDNDKDTKNNCNINIDEEKKCNDIDERKEQLNSYEDTKHDDDDDNFNFTSDNTSNSDTNDSNDYVNISPQQVNVFDRNVFSKVGQGDLPPLEASTPQSQNRAPSTPQSQNRAPSTPSQEQPHAPSPEPPPDQTCPVDDLYEWVAVTGKRPTKFGKKKSGRWRHGGNEFDYQIQWASGETTFEPETLAKEYAADAIEEFNLKHQPGTTQNFQPDLELPEAKCEEPTENNQAQPDQEPTTTSFANVCNYVHIQFFCYLTKLLPTKSYSGWRNIKTPQNRAEMLKSPERERWLAAERKELNSLQKKGTWKRVKKVKKKPISCTWVYKLKPPTTLNPEPIFKARLCAHGFKQREGIDYSSTFAQVATLKAFRILLWLSVFLKYRCTQMDVESAFLAGKLDKEIYMSPPAGYEDEIGNVVLIKSIYGLKQAPRIWYYTLVQALHSLGFKELITDSCVFKHTTSNCYLLVFVDDIICITSDEKFRTQVETKLQTIFDIKILGTLRHFIGIQIDIDKHGSLHIHQNDYVQKLSDVFKNFFTNRSSKVNAPCDPTVKFTTQQQPTSSVEQKKMANYPYRKLIGSLLYLLGTRPELYFIIISLSRFVNNPGFVHWLAALRVLFYVCNTPLFGLLIQPGQKLQLTVYVDSDHGGALDDRKSISGYIIYLGNTPIIWRSRRQKGKPAVSSCEAEYIALSACINEMVWINAFLSELSFRIPLPIPMFCDNNSANDLAHNPVHHDRTKHIDIRYHRIREFIYDGTVEIYYVESAENPADIFTKSVSVSVFKKLIGKIYGKFPT